MKKLHLNVSLFIAMIAALFVVPSCSKENMEKMKNSNLVIRMTDAPADYDAVNIDLAGVMAFSDDQGWFALDAHTGIYNVLDLSNGVEVVLVDQEISAGFITQIQLILGSENTVVIDGESQPLDISGSVSTTLAIVADMQAGETYSFLFDFNAAASVLENADGSFSIDPVVNVVTEIDGAVEGSISPALNGILVQAIAQTDGSVVTTYTNSSGEFFLQGMAEGGYNISIIPGSSLLNLNAVTVNSVGVQSGSTTDVGVISLL